MLVSLRLMNNLQLQSASENNPSLGKGAKGTGVAELQEALYDMGYTMSKSFAKLDRADGIYGDEVVTAIQAFQKANGLKIDGIAGRKTLSLIDRLIALNPNLEAPNPVLVAIEEFGDRSRPASLRRRSNW